MPAKTDVNTLPDDKEFVGDGTASEFAQAVANAYADIVKKGIIFIIGDQKFNQNEIELSKTFLTYISARKYILGETDKTAPEKEKKWLSNVRDENKNLVLKLQAYVNIKKLKSDLDAMSLKEAAAPSAATPAPENQPAVGEDLSGVDLTALTFLVYYNPKDPALKNDSDQETYSRWAVDNINREISALNIQTYDLDTVEKLANERGLLQEADSGSVGIGLLLAQKVFAELYAEVTPAVSYQGTKGHAILSVKVFVRTTGSLIATIEKGGQEYESSSLQASIKMSMREASKKIRDELTVSLKKYVNNGRFYFVRLTGVQSFSDASQFTTALGNIDGVVNITLKSGSKEDMVYDFNLQYKGKPMDAVNRIFDALSGKPGFEKLDLKEIRGNELTFTLQ